MYNDELRICGVKLYVLAQVDSSSGFNLSTVKNPRAKAAKKIRSHLTLLLIQKDSSKSLTAVLS
ncbi:uncharacterized protein RAG0_16541 [Rhynchosporium agropyri]|uniref:Uncharacterized protein n=3 Tax=Rhynchosporium TaxID=38037 RepID=A0A1E1MWW3_RHYSE|nr:uncharacterized protein RAG0_16541 [Rhynchosporium agropyri]CZT13747.1 uncharacterized protein RCO7_15264 [Rhynchosporium commune]CZT53425.1 uncharacterized protein RSE6_14981 [Rhynchosporium secalis]